ncbi:helix-turn-helix transcriptional regulator [Mycobacterium hubeiense]|uniref:helix-turn-helix transcriptional regulator n=1 Tax=Mycobacterium hubeiense TaxID=1867256 RepID=UPI000C7F5A43|nr:helix-turn-helix transcriptional regulator [Mycobacterium sp. QGD 101]
MTTVDTRLHELGVRIRAARINRGDTQADVAEAVGIHRTHLSAIEAGRENITVGTLYRLADHFGVPATLLLPD